MAATQVFQEAVSSTGADYLQARARLLAAAGAEQVLRQVAGDESRSADARWLAEILLARKRHPEEFQRLETILCHRAAVMNPTGRVNDVISQIDELNFEPVHIKAAPALLEQRARRRAEQHGKSVEWWTEYFGRKTLPRSSHWGLIAGEVLLKGWLLSEDLPEGEVISADRTPDLPGVVSVREALRRGASPDRLPENVCPVLSHELYLLNAMQILGELGERRAAPALERVLEDQSRPLLLRLKALQAVDGIGAKESVEALVRVALSREEVRALRTGALRAAVHVGGREVLEEMKRRAPDEPDRRFSLRGLVRQLEEEIENSPAKRLRVTPADRLFGTTE